MKDQSPIKNQNVAIKVAMIGDAEVGKTSLSVLYSEGRFDQEYLQTFGVNFIEKKVKVRSSGVTFSVWDLGGADEYNNNLLPIVCNDAVCMLFMFDLSRAITLSSVREWFKKARNLNKKAIPFLIGTKYDVFLTMNHKEKIDIVNQARKYANAMKAPLIFCSALHSINITAIFKIMFSKVFDLKCPIKPILEPNEPIIEY